MRSFQKTKALSVAKSLISFLDPWDYSPKALVIYQVRAARFIEP
jgi:hypothetical protein